MKKINQYKLVDGQLVPGVTSIVGCINKPGLNAWLSKNTKEFTDKVSTEGKDFGSRIHEIIQADFGGQELILTKKEQTILDNFKKISKKWKIKKMEMDLVHEEHKFGGTIDIVALVDGYMTIVDIKTSKAIFRDVELQIAGYHLLYSQASKCKIAHLNKQTLGWQLLDIETAGLEKIFLSCKTIWEFMNKK